MLDIFQGPLGFGPFHLAFFFFNCMFYFVCFWHVGILLVFLILGFNTLDFLVAQIVKRLPTMQETQIQSLGREDLLEKEMATHSSILAWKNPMDGGTWLAHGLAEFSGLSN